MCDVTMGLMAAGAVLQVASGIGQARSQQQAANFQAEQAQRNASLAEQQAQDAEYRGRLASDEQQRKTGQMLSEQRSAMGASGLDVSSGSNLGLLGDTAMIGAQDALTIQSNAAREAWAYRNQAQDYESQASMYQATGKNAMTAGLVGAGATILGSASQFSGALGSSTPFSNTVVGNKAWDTPTAGAAWSGPTTSATVKFF